MRVLVINCGSSSLKFELIDTAAESAGSAHVIPVDEAVIIARDTAHCLNA